MQVNNIVCAHVCLSEFNRRWKCKVARLARHTHQHTGGLISSYHSVSTDVHKHTSVCMLSQLRCRHCACVAVCVAAWSSTLLFYRGCSLKPCLPGLLHLKPVWDSREPTGKSVEDCGYVLQLAPCSSSVSSSSFSSVRVSVYRTLELWVQAAGASASILQGSPGHSELLFAHLLSDITPGAESVKVGYPVVTLNGESFRFRVLTFLHSNIKETRRPMCGSHRLLNYLIVSNFIARNFLAGFKLCGFRRCPSGSYWF